MPDAFAYDVCLCHAPADEQTVAMPLTTALERRGLKVWQFGRETTIALEGHRDGTGFVARILLLNIGEKSA